MPQSRWKRLLSRLKRRPPSDVSSSRNSRATPPAVPALVDRASETSADPPPSDPFALLERLSELEQQPDQGFVPDSAFEAKVEQLLAAHDTGAAIGQMAAFGRDVNVSPQLALRLARTLYERGRVAEALHLWERLCQSPEAAAEAHLSLGSHWKRQADLEVALQHYETVLALDFEHEQAQRQADRLREQLQPPSFSAAPTIISGNESGLNRRFALQREIGAGGGGRVYLALDRELGRPTAVKVLHRRVAAQAAPRAQLFCEARVAASLHHPQIITIYELDEPAGLIAMEYCAGGTLREVIDQQAPIAPATALRLLAQMCQVLGWVHQMGLVHCDIKPANWLFRQQAKPPATPILTDFGIAQAVAQGDDPRTARGTVAYMAPEQRSGAAPGPQADLYACGLIILELLLGPGLGSLRHDFSASSALPDRRALESALASVLDDRVETDVLALIGELTDPSPGSRAADARVCACRARDVAGRLDAAAEHRRLLDELHRLAGPHPRTAEIERWLQSRVRSD
jgi:tetratricopeptide (TPR) repeat protein